MDYIQNRPWLLFVAFLAQFVSISHAAKTDVVTYGSVFKLINHDYNVRLHSHDVKYGSGSGQQSITGTELQEDVNSHWVALNVTHESYKRGYPIKCGDVIRLQHLETKRNLHSHLFSSPLSNQQEVSCYGEEGAGDSGDHWKVVCSSDVWKRSANIKLLHVDTDAYLSASGKTFGRPINGQMEITGIPNSYQATEWKTSEGVFINPSEDIKSGHTEL